MIQAKRIHATPLHCQQGAVLVIALSFLLILTIIGLASIKSARLNERMASNATVHAQVFQATEAALNEGEVQFLNTACDALRLSKEIPDPSVAEFWLDRDSENNCKNKEGDDVCVLVDCIENLQGENENYPVENCLYVLTKLQRTAAEEAAASSDPDACGGYYYVTAKSQSKQGLVVVLQTTVFRTY